MDPATLSTMLADPRVTAPRPRPPAGDRPPARAVGHPPIGTATLAAKRALALSGGGAKGSFQVGALKFLYEERHLRPRIVVGTSVGSVNGIKLAEGETGDSATPGHTTGFAGLERSWLDVAGNDDFFVEKKVFRDLKDFAASAAELASDIETSVALSWVAVALAGPFALAAAGTATANALNIAEAAELVEKFLYIDGLVSLSPVRNKLDDPKYLDLALADGSKIDFRAIWVGMLSGKGYCTDSHGKLYELADPTKPIGTVTKVTTSVLASAAQPLFMESPIVEGKLGNQPFKEKGFDGGVREIVGVRCAIQLGATEVFAILCQPIDNGLASIVEQSLGEELELVPGVKLPAGTKFFNATKRRWKSVLELAERGLGLALDEVLDNDLAAAGDADVTVIRPYIEVHDGMTLRPGLIRVNIAHGWMCAFDAFHPEAQHPFSFLAGGNRLITENRMWKERYRLAKQALGVLAGAAIPTSMVAKLNQTFDTAIHDCNARIRDGLALRLAIDPASLPADTDGWDD